MSIEIKSFDKRNVEKVQREVMAAVEAVMHKYGVKPNYKGGRYSPVRFSLNIDLDLLAESPSGEEMPASFPRDAMRVGLPAHCYGKVCVVNGRRYKITGIKTRNRKYPVLATLLVDGKQYKLPVSSVRAGLTA
jgi:hypothetical protein